MNWINNVIEDIQHRILKTSSSNRGDSVGDEARPESEAHNNSEQIRRFQGRLCDLDKRLLELR